MTRGGHRARAPSIQSETDNELTLEQEQVQIFGDEDKPTSRIDKEDETSLAAQLESTHIEEEDMPSNTVEEVGPKSTVPEPGCFNGNRAEINDWWRGMKFYMRFNKIKTADDKVTACVARMKGGTAGELAQLIADEMDKKEDTLYS